MAKWGEGDPRWIVEERPDATNVNNWHWTEKNATEWSKIRLKALFEKLIVEDGAMKCEITKLSESTGEANCLNRKSKLIFFYEWSLEFEWKGRIAGNEEEYKGKIKVANFSEEYALKEVDIEVSTENSSKFDDQLKHLLKSKGVPVVRDLLGQYLRELKEEYSKDIILPTKAETAAEVIRNFAPLNVASSSAASAAANTDKSKKAAVGVKIDTKQLTLSEEFHCTAEDLYRALTIKEMVQAFTHSDCLLEPEKGGKFALFNGMVSGDFVELVKNEKIVQRWRFKSWPEAHFSTVTLKLKQKEAGTVVEMLQTGIPSSDFARTKEGWKRYYWDSLKATFGFGALLT